MTTDNTVTVTQADIDRALPFIEGFTPGNLYSDQTMVLMRKFDHHPLVQAFASHRTTGAANTHEREAVWDREPNLGTSTPEPSLRAIITAYYHTYFPKIKATALTEQYIAALSQDPETQAEGFHWIDGEPPHNDYERILVENDRGIFLVYWETDGCLEWCWICPDGKHDDRPLRGNAIIRWAKIPAALSQPEARNVEVIGADIDAPADGPHEQRLRDQRKFSQPEAGEA